MYLHTPSVSRSIEALWIDPIDKKTKQRIENGKNQDKLIDQMIVDGKILEMIDYRPASAELELLLRKSLHRTMFVFDSQTWALNGANIVKYAKFDDTKASNHKQSFTKARLAKMQQKANTSSRTKPENKPIEIYIQALASYDWVFTNTVEANILSAWQEIEKAYYNEPKQMGPYWAIFHRQQPDKHGSFGLGHGMNADWWWDDGLGAWIAVHPHLLKRDENRQYVNKPLVNEIKFLRM